MPVYIWIILYSFMIVITSIIIHLCDVYLFYNHTDVDCIIYGCMAMVWPITLLGLGTIGIFIGISYLGKSITNKVIILIDSYKKGD